MGSKVHRSVINESRYVPRSTATFDLTLTPSQRKTLCTCKYNKVDLHQELALMTTMRLVHRAANRKVLV